MRAHGFAKPVISVTCCLAAVAAGAWGGPALRSQRPVIKTGVRYATKDKPQSKLWYAHGHWWAWLPTEEGSGVWQRGARRWKRVRALRGGLRALPGQADVWADESGARAVLLGQEQMAVVGLRFAPGRRTCVIDGAPTVWPVEEPGEGGKRTETATIARDGTGRWWVAYDEGRHMWVRASLDPSATHWTEPIRVGGPASRDDICSIAAMPGAVGVIWSDQETQALYFRRHLDVDPPERWQETETVARGGRTADDHINVAVGPDGSVYVATKNSVDTDDEPQLCLRVRRPDGRWENHPYAERTSLREPSRPVVVLGGSPARLFLCHSLYTRARDRGTADSRRPNYIALIECDCVALDLGKPSRELIVAERNVNDVTSCKSALPSGAPWIALASDGAGNVYEGLLAAPRK